MGKCGSCGAEVSEKDKFCPICGAKIEDKADGKKVCAACGAELKNEDRFCPACGTRVEEKPTACPKCGAKFEDGDRFCRDCGAAIGGAPVGKRAKSGGGIAAVRDKAVAFEKKNHIFANVLVIMLAIVVLFVSLFAPIKLSATNITNFMSDGMGGSDSSAVYTVDQSIFQVFGAWGYVNLDPDDKADKKKADELDAELAAIMKDVTAEVLKWQKNNEDATEEEMMDAAMRISAKHMSEVNVLAVSFAGVYDNVDSNLADLVSATYAETLLALIFATLIALTAIALATVSLVFIILAAIGMVKKRDAKASAYFKTALIMSGVGLILLSLAPSLISLGSMFAVALTAALTYFAYAAVRGVAGGKSVALLIKHTVLSALAVVAFFLLCGSLLSVDITTLVSTSGEEASFSVGAPLGMAFETLIISGSLFSLNKVEIFYSVTSNVAAIFVLAVVAGAMAVLLAGMLKSFAKLGTAEDDGARIQVLPLMAAIILAVGALVVGVLGAVAEPPDVTGTKMPSVGMAFAFYVNAKVYVSLAFAVISVLFAALFVPKAKRDATA